MYVWEEKKNITQDDNYKNGEWSNICSSSEIVFPAQINKEAVINECFLTNTVSVCDCFQTNNVIICV